MTPRSLPLGLLPLAVLAVAIVYRLVKARMARRSAILRGAFSSR